MDKFMKIAADEAEIGVKNGEGGPFGAVILDNDRKYFSKGKQ